MRVGSFRVCRQVNGYHMDPIAVSERKRVHRELGPCSTVHAAFSYFLNVSFYQIAIIYYITAPKPQ